MDISYSSLFLIPILLIGSYSSSIHHETPEVENADSPRLSLIQSSPTSLLVQVENFDANTDIQLNCDSVEQSTKLSVLKNAVFILPDFEEKISEKYGNDSDEKKLSIEFEIDWFTSGHEYDCIIFGSDSGNGLKTYDKETITFHSNGLASHSYSNLNLTVDWDGLWLKWETIGATIWDIVHIKDMNHQNYYTHSFGEWTDEENLAYVGGLRASSYLLGIEGPDLNGNENEIVWYRFDYDGERCTNEIECPSEITLQYASKDDY